MGPVKSQKDFFAGLFFLGVSAVFAIGLKDLSVGSAFRMGPGYFPLVLVILLALFGAILLINGFRASGAPISALPWRAPALIILPIVAFGATLHGLGLIPALGIAVFATTIANATWSLLASLMTTAVIVGLCWAIFLWGLGLPIRAFGPWVAGY